MLEHKIFEGLKSSYEQEVEIIHSIPGELDYLLSTPQIVKLIILASTQMLDPLLPDQFITIGTHLDLYHEQPTLVMEKGSIRVDLTVDKVEENYIWLDVECFDKVGRISHGKYERAIVDKERLRFGTYERMDRHKL